MKKKKIKAELSKTKKKLAETQAKLNKIKATSVINEKPAASPKTVNTAKTVRKVKTPTISKITKTAKASG